jgi:DNA invertase Pin-like site-specific DNA recombinase
VRHGENIMAITKESIAAARQAGKDVGPRAVAARYRPSIGKVEVEFDNGVTLAVPARLIQGLSNAGTSDLSKIEITPSGWGLHFPRLDADVYVPALFEGIYGSKAWMKQAARVAGSTRSPAKAAAARANGKKGGRPRKVPVLVVHA